MEAKESRIPAQNAAEFETLEKLLGRLPGHRGSLFKELTEKWAGKEVEMDHFCPGPQERLNVSGKAMKRSLGAEVATRTAEKPIASVVKLEKKILVRFLMLIQLHYREQNECEAVLECRVQPSKPQERYAEITSQLIQLQSDVTDFLNDDYSDAAYQCFMGDYLSQVRKLMGMKAT
uniref:Uncharacterized protein n=1 Tax=Ditylenchus dipsaci TaxID=166011 RepID=A0A915EQU8_9BILA